MAEKFDFEAALKAVQSGQSITRKDGVLGSPVKSLTEAALEAELDLGLAEDLAGAVRPLVAVSGPSIHRFSRNLNDRFGSKRTIELVRLDNVSKVKYRLSQRLCQARVEVMD